MADYPSSIPAIAANKTNATPAATTGHETNPAYTEDHAAHHNKLAAELIAALTELGVNPSGTYADVAARLDALAGAGAGGNPSPIWKLNGATLANATTVTLDRAPGWLSGQRVILAIEAYSGACEIRTATSYAGTTVTLSSALTRAHPNAATVTVVTDSVSLLLFGAYGDGSADDTVSIQAAIDEVVRNASGVWIEGHGKTYNVTAPLYAATGTRLRAGIQRAAAGYGPDDTTNAMLVSCQDLPVAFTADAATDTFTTSSPHGIGQVGNKIAFKGTSLPGGITAGRVYYVKTLPNSTTFTISATSGGATLDVTANGSGTAYPDINATERLYLFDWTLLTQGLVKKGILTNLQQPAIWWKARVDNATDTGVTMGGQEAWIFGLQCLTCTVGLQLGVVGDATMTCSLVKFFGLDVETSTTAGVKYGYATDILIDGYHGEAQPIHHLLDTGGTMLNVTFVQPHITYRGTDIGWKINAGGGSNSSYQIIGARAYGAGAGDKIINDVDRSRDLVLSQLDQQGVLHMLVQPAGNVIWRRLEGVGARAVLSFGTIPANSVATQTISVPGATSAMAAQASPEGNIGTGLIWSARVSAADTVTVLVGNVTTGAVASFDQNWRVAVTPAA